MISVRNTFIGTLIILLSALGITAANAQDTSYVRKHGNLLSVKCFGYNDGFNIRNKSTGLRYIPDLHSGLGVGVWCKYFPFDVCFRQEISLVGSGKYHRLKTTDMQLRGYNRFFAGDIYIQKYSGFYESPNRRYLSDMLDMSNYDYSPDLTVFQFDMVGKYIFNHERFSYKAGFTANERQLISSGSPTLGAALYYLKIKSDSMLISESSINMESCNLGINGGYAHNFVLDSHSILFASGSLGINASNIMSHRRHEIIKLRPVCHLKAAYWYNMDKWSFGTTHTYNIIHQQFAGNLTLYVHTRRSEIMVIRRF